MSLNVSTTQLPKQVWQQPEQFSPIQLIRILKNLRWQAGSQEAIRIHAAAYTDNNIAQTITLARTENAIQILTQQTTLTSHEGILPPYLHEILLNQYHEEKTDFYDFLNLLNNVFLHIDYKQEERRWLLLRAESDRRLLETTRPKGTVRPSLTEVISRVCAVPLDTQRRKWVQYSHLFGIHSRGLPQLKALLEHYFDIHLSIKSQALTQYPIAVQDRTRLQTTNAKCQNTQSIHALGQGFLLGKKVWMTRQQLCITVFPESKLHLQQLLNKDAWKTEMAEMIRFYLRDHTGLIIQTKAPQHWYQPIPLSSKAISVRLGRGFHLTGRAQGSAPLITINHRSKE